MEEVPRDVGGSCLMTEDGDVGGTGVFFKGGLYDAVLKAQADGLVLVVFVAGENEESVKMEQTTFRDPQVVDEVKKQSLVLRLQEGTTDADNFSKIYPLGRLPSITILGIQTSPQKFSRLHNQLEGFQNAEEFLAALRKAAETQKAIAISAFLALLSSANLTGVNPAIPAPVPQLQGNSSDQDLRVESNPILVAQSPAPQQVEVSPSGFEESMDVDLPGRTEPTEVSRNSSGLESNPIPSGEPLRTERSEGREPDGSIASGTSRLAAKSEPMQTESQASQNAQNWTKSFSKQANGKKSNLRREQSGTNQVRVRTGPFPVQVRLTNGEAIQGTFESDQVLRDVKHFVDLQRTDGNMEYRLALPSIPRKVFTVEDMDKTLAKLDIGPRSQLILVGNATLTENASHARASTENIPDCTSHSESTPAGDSYFGRILSYVNPFAYIRPGVSQDEESSTSASHNEASPATIRALREGIQPPMPNSSRPQQSFLTSASNGGANETTQAGSLNQRRARGGNVNVHTLRREHEGSPQGNMYWNGNSTQFGGNDEAKED